MYLLQTQPLQPQRQQTDGQLSVENDFDIDAASLLLERSETVCGQCM
jgi:hypothetical protein